MRPPDFIIQWIVESATHVEVLVVATVATSSLIAATFLWLWHKPLKSERWVLYFGMAFLCFALQYFLVLLGVGDVPLVLLSTANNLLFLAAALSIRGHVRLFPAWAWVVGVVACGVDFFEPFGIWNRFPDATFSACVLSLLGWSLFSQISLRRHRGLVALALSGALLYALLNLLYAFAPPLTEADPWPSFKVALVDAGISNVGIRQAFDSFLFATALVLKLPLVGAAFILVMRALGLISLPTLLETLREVTAGKSEYFSSSGIVKAIGVSMKAYKAAICFRLPGLQNLRVGWWEWPGDFEEPYFREASFPDQETLEGQVLATGQRLEDTAFRDDGEGVSAETRRRKRANRSLLIEPILYHGRVIGCLKLVWNTPRAFTGTTTQLAQKVVQLVAPAIESRRRTLALAFWGDRLHQTAPRLLTNANVGEHHFLTKLVFETLSPLAVGISLDLGFEAVWSAVGDSGDTYGSLAPDRAEEVREKVEWFAREVQNRGFETRTTDVKSKGFPIGRLLTVWPVSDVGPPEMVPVLPERPLIAPDKLHLETFAALIASSVLEATQLELGSLATRVQVILSRTELQSFEDWQAVLTPTLREAGLVWAAARTRQGEFYGDSDPVEWARDLDSAEVEDSTKDGRIRIFSAPEPCDSAYKVIQLILPTAGAELFLGVRRKGFGPEIRQGWPWRGFLDRLIEASDTALERITAKEKTEKLQQEASQFRHLMGTLVTTAAHIHELRNLAKNLNDSAALLEDAQRLGKLDSQEAMVQIAALKTSSKRLLDMTKELNENRVSSRCALIEPIQHLEEALKAALLHSSIQLRVEVEPRLEVAVPFLVVRDALYCLVGNSMDAMREQGGTISITAEEDDAQILCHVTDDGPGIPEEIVDQLFEWGISTKESTGKGLYLTRLELRGVDSDIQLATDPPPGHTRFTLKLKKPPQETELLEQERNWTWLAKPS